MLLDTQPTYSNVFAAKLYEKELYNKGPHYNQPE